MNPKHHQRSHADRQGVVQLAFSIHGSSKRIEVWNDDGKSPHERILPMNSAIDMAIRFRGKGKTRAVVLYDLAWKDQFSDLVREQKVRNIHSLRSKQITPDRPC